MAPHGAHSGNPPIWYQHRGLLLMTTPTRLRAGKGVTQEPVLGARPAAPEACKLRKCLISSRRCIVFKKARDQINRLSARGAMGSTRQGRRLCNRRNDNHAFISNNPVLRQHSNGQ